MSADLAPATVRDDDVRIRRILIATDFSEASADALRVGAGLGRAFGAELLIVHVLADVDVRPSVEAALGMRPGDLLERRIGEAEGRLRGLEATLGRGHSHASVRCGAAAAEIVRLATATPVDVIVLGCHGPALPRGPCAQPVAERVRERAPCPVIVAAGRTDGSGVSAPAQARSMHGVLVATDLTQGSDAAVRWGRAIGRRLGCPVHTLHVIDTRRQWRNLGTGAGEPHTIRFGDPVEQILACARELGDDLIVLGTRRRCRLGRRSSRGVGRAVAERSTVPTLTVR